MGIGNTLLTGIMGREQARDNQAAIRGATAAQTQANDAAIAEQRRQFDLAMAEQTRQFDLAREEEQSRFNFARDEELNRYNQARADQAPWLQSGQAALGRLNDPGAFQASPEYNFLRQEGQRGLEGSAAARGGAFSGNALRALSEFNQGLAGREFSNWWNRNASQAGIGQTAAGQVGSLGAQGAANVGGLGVQGAANIGQLGQSAAGNIGSWATNMGTNIGNLMQNSGQARANGALATQASNNQWLNNMMQSQQNSRNNFMQWFGMFGGG